MSFDVYEIMRQVKQGKIELCFYYDTTDNIVKHAYMYHTLKSLKSKYSVSFATWAGFHRSDINIMGDNSNLDLLCVKTKKWTSDLTDRNAVETILDFMENAKWFTANGRDITLSHVVSNDIKKGIYIIPLMS